MKEITKINSGSAVIKIAFLAKSKECTATISPLITWSTWCANDDAKDDNDSENDNDTFYEMGLYKLDWVSVTFAITSAVSLKSWHRPTLDLAKKSSTNLTPML